MPAPGAAQDTFTEEEINLISGSVDVRLGGTHLSPMLSVKPSPGALFCKSVIISRCTLKIWKQKVK